MIEYDIFNILRDDNFILEEIIIQLVIKINKFINY